MLLLSSLSVIGQHSRTQTGPLVFEARQISSESYESVGVADVNNDGKVDLVSGAFWYEGPDFVDRHFMGSAERHGEYWDDFFTVFLDVNNDGLTDVITGGWFEKKLIWKQNPGDNGLWKEHLIAIPGSIETAGAWDVDQDGVVEIIPNTPNDSLAIYRLEKNGKPSTFSKHIIYEKHGHGLGFGDINGDGRGDVIVPDGWLEAPLKPFSEPWMFHKEFELGTASVPILVVDVNKDGLKDLIVGQGHGYGLDWYQQKLDDKKRTWKKHAIDPYNSQYHTMAWEDLDGDGEPELITGKRYRAHNGKDPGGKDAYGLYYFKWDGHQFIKQVIAYGPFGKTKGTGIYFEVLDIDGNTKKDLILAGKDGLFIYYNN